MNVPVNANDPTRVPGAVWKWRIGRQWRASRSSALVQLIFLAVGLVILVWLWMPPNDGVLTLFMQVFTTIIYVWVVVLLFGPYRSVRTMKGK